MEENKIIGHFCGGAGISISDKAISMVSDLGEGFAEIEYNYIDTSDSNYHNLENKRGSFWQVKTKSHARGLIDGSGGERATNLDDILGNIADYLDQKKIKKAVTGEYHMVVFSASGGTGNVAAQGIVMTLMERNIPTFCVCVGDSSTSIYTTNTLKVLESFDKLAIRKNKALCMIYDNNNAEHNGSEDIAEKAVNKKIFNTVSSMALFLSRGLESIDNQDMTYFLNQTDYKSFHAEPGLYGVHVYSGQVDLPKGAIPTGARTLLKEGTEGPGTGLTLLHSKKGFVIHENPKTIYSEQFPLHMVAYANFFTTEHKILLKTSDDYNNIAKSIKHERIASEVGEENEDGFVL